MLCYFFFNDTATTEIYTLSLHDALPIWKDPGSPRVREQHRIPRRDQPNRRAGPAVGHRGSGQIQQFGDRKSTRLNSSHANISYAVFCLKKKKKTKLEITNR